MGIWHGVPGVLSNQNRTVSLCECIRPWNEDSLLVNHVYNVLVLCPNNYWPLISRKQKFEACRVNTSVLITLPVIVWKTHKRKLLKTRNRWCKMTKVYNRTKRNVFPDQPAICFHFQQEIPPDLDQHN